MRHALAVVLLLVACASEAAPKPPAPPPSGARPRFRPHVGTIEKTTIAADGSAAVSVDDQGEVRLWIALDGREPPVFVPGFGAAALAVTRRPDGAIVVVLQDVGGATSSQLYGPGGGFVETHAYPTAGEWLAVAVHPAGGHFVSLGADHTLRLHDLEGRVLALYEAPAHRPVTLWMSNDGRRLAVTDWTEKRTRTTITRFELDVVRGTIAVAGEPESFLHIAGVEPTFSPSLSRVAYVMPTQAHAEIVNLDTSIIEKVELASSGPMTFIAMPAEDRVVVAGRAGTALLASTTVEGMRRIAAGPFVSGSQSSGGGRVVAGDDEWLFVLGGTARYLGYDRLAIQHVSISPSGRTVAWVDHHGLVVQPIDDEARRMKTEGRPGPFALIDDEHAVITSLRGTRIVQLGTGASLAELPGPTGKGLVAFHTPARILRHTVGTTTQLTRIDRALRPTPLAVVPAATRVGLVQTGARAGVWIVASTSVYHQSLADAAAGRKLPKPERYRDLLTIDSAGVVHRRETSPSGTSITSDSGDSRPPTVIEGRDIDKILVSPWGRTYLAATDTALSLYDARSGRLRFELGGDFRPARVAWSEDGIRVAVATSRSLVVIDAFGGEVVFARCAGTFRTRWSAPVIASPQAGPVAAHCALTGR